MIPFGIYSAGGVLGDIELHGLAILFDEEFEAGGAAALANLINTVSKGAKGRGASEISTVLTSTA